ncbi:hypothetical protein [Shinella sedimenti]|uniref:Uncharacterized protein n=1 Tax=Shinella sedimenti TaxID=2919913 RepID=A0ABT0CQ71_9HYPH|nr:hypothetical protein [Shinella sedimenti]MCJ8150758.1 hypothetical protein [Shinella sedimenti]
MATDIRSSAQAIVLIIMRVCRFCVSLGVSANHHMEKRNRHGQALAELQKAAVRSVAIDITNVHDGQWDDRKWVHIALNHEVLIEEAGDRAPEAPLWMVSRRLRFRRR